MKDLKRITDNIHNLRTIRGLTIAYMAEALDITPSGYFKIERGQTNMSVAHLIQIAMILEVKPAELLERERNELFLNAAQTDYRVKYRELEDQIIRLSQEFEKFRQLHADQTRSNKKIKGNKVQKRNNT